MKCFWLIVKLILFLHGHYETNAIPACAISEEDRATTFALKDTKRHVPVVTLST